MANTRILQVIPYFHPAYAFGGPVEVAYQISAELVKRGNEVTVYTTDAADFKSRLSVESPVLLDGIEVHYFRNISMIPITRSRLFLTPNMLPVLKEKIRTFDTVHLHEYWTFQNVVVHHYAKKYDVPYILEAHGSLPNISATWIERERSKLVFDVLFGYRLLKDASKVIALNQTEARLYSRMGLHGNRIAVVPNGIDLKKYADLPAEGSFRKMFKLPEDMKIVLYLGRIHRTKGIDLLVKAYCYLVKNMKHDDTILAIVGPDDGYLQQARMLVNSLGISKSVLFTGFISQANKLKAFVDAEVFITPSFRGFPMTFLEACVTGTPIVTTTMGDNLTWIKGNVGYVTLPTSSDIAKALDRVISDSELRKKFSKNCREIARSRFSIEKVVDMMEQLYERKVRGTLRRS